MGGVLSILLVEDEAMIAMDIKMRLTVAGFRVIGIVATGEDAIAVVREAAPDLVLMDGRLSGKIDGVEAMRRVRETHTSLPFIFITGFTNEEFIARAQALGPVACMTKPIDFDKLLSIIKTIQ